MSNEWKMVPVDLLRRLIAATKLARGHGSPTQLQAELILKAPVPPAGDVEVLGYIVDDGMAKSYHKGFPHWAADYVVTELVDRAHVTHLAAERDGLLGKIETTDKAYDIVVETSRQMFVEMQHLQSELTKALEDLRLEKLAGAAIRRQAEDFKALSWERGELLTKARELLTQVQPCNENYVAVPGAWFLRRDTFLAPQSAPAAKDGESGETICLLCFDKKTVPGPKHGDFVRDCPECCGEEG